MNRNRKNVVRLSESKLRNMIKESVKSVLHESNYTLNGLTEEDEQCCNRIIELSNRIAKYAEQYILTKRAGKGQDALTWSNGIHECANEILSEYDKL